MENIEARHFVHNVEVRALIAHFPSGDVPGYHIRFLVEEAANPPQSPQWGPWLFVPKEYAALLLQGVKKIL